jgi:hypothetical protein
MLNEVVDAIDEGWYELLPRVCISICDHQVGREGVHHVLEGPLMPCAHQIVKCDTVKMLRRETNDGGVMA